MKESQDISRAGDTVEALQQQLADLEADLQNETQTLQASDSLNEKLEVIKLKPKKTDITINLVTLVWVPFWKAGESITSAWE